MVSTNNDNVPATRVCSPRKEAVVHRKAFIGGRLAVKYIPCNNEAFDPLLLNTLNQPVEKGLVFQVALTTVKLVTKVPV